MNLFLLLSAILTTVDVTFALIFIGLLVFKSIPDFLFIYSVTSFFHKRHLIRYFLILQFIYIFYVSIIPFSGIWGRYT